MVYSVFLLYLYSALAAAKEAAQFWNDGRYKRPYRRHIPNDKKKSTVHRFRGVYFIFDQISRIFPQFKEVESYYSVYANGTNDIVSRQRMTLWWHIDADCWQKRARKPMSFISETSYGVHFVPVVAFTTYIIIFRFLFFTSFFFLLSYTVYMWSIKILCDTCTSTQFGWNFI